MAEEQKATEKGQEISQAYLSLVWWKFKKNRLAVVGGIVILIFYTVCGLFAEFFTPYTINHETDYLEARPQTLHFVDEAGNFHLRPFVYGLEETVDQALRKRIYLVDTSKQYPLYLFVRAEPYKLLGFIPSVYSEKNALDSSTDKCSDCTQWFNPLFLKKVGLYLRKLPEYSKSVKGEGLVMNWVWCGLSEKLRNRQSFSRNC